MANQRSERSSEVSLETLLAVVALFNLIENPAFVSPKFLTLQYRLSAHLNISKMTNLPQPNPRPKPDSEDEFGPGDWPDNDAMATVDAHVDVLMKSAPAAPAEQKYGLHDYKLLTPTRKSTLKILNMQNQRRERGSAPPTTPTPTCELGPPRLLQPVLSTDTAVAHTSFTPALREPSAEGSFAPPRHEPSKGSREPSQDPFHLELPCAPAVAPPYCEPSRDLSGAPQPLRDHLVPPHGWPHPHPPSRYPHPPPGYPPYPGGPPPFPQPYQYPAYNPGYGYHPHPPNRSVSTGPDPAAPVEPHTPAISAIASTSPIEPTTALSAIASTDPVLVQPTPKVLKLEDLGQLHPIRPIAPDRPLSGPAVHAAASTMSQSTAQVGHASSAIDEGDEPEGWEDLQKELNGSLLDKITERGDSDDDGSNKENRSPKGKAGRPSSDDLLLLDDRLMAIQGEIQSLATKLGRNPANILKLLVGRIRTGGTNTWSSYLKYYKVNEEEELQRLPDPSLYDMGTAEGRIDARKACYKLFKEDDPTSHSNFLRIWSENEALTESDRTAVQRSRSFRKHTSEGQKLVIRAEHNGLQGMFVLVGENICHDRSLRFLYASPTLTAFFQHHFLRSPNEFLDHLQAFAYTGVAKLIMNANLRTHLAAQEDSDDIKATCVDTTASQKAIKAAIIDTTVSQTAGGQSSSSVENVKGEDEDAGRATDELHAFFIKDAACVGIDITSGQGKKFPWLSLLDICSKEGVKLINYPDMVSPPGKLKAGQKSKGIANLSKGHMQALLKQIRDSRRPLSFATRTPDDIQGKEVVTLEFLSGSQILTSVNTKSKSASRKKTSDHVNDDDDDDDEAEFTDSQNDKKKRAARNEALSDIIDDDDEEDDEADFTDPMYIPHTPRTPRAPRIARSRKATTIVDDFVSMGSPGGATESRSMESATQEKVQGVKRPLTSSGEGRDEKRRRASPPTSSQAVSSTDNTLTVRKVAAVSVSTSVSKPVATSAEPVATSVANIGPPKNPSSGPPLAPYPQNPTSGPPLAAYSQNPTSRPLPAAYPQNPTSGPLPTAYHQNPLSGPPPAAYPPNLTSGVPPAAYPSNPTSENPTYHQNPMSGPPPAAYPSNLTSGVPPAAYPLNPTSENPMSGPYPSGVPPAAYPSNPTSENPTSGPVPAAYHQNPLSGPPPAAYPPNPTSGLPPAAYPSNTVSGPLPPYPPAQPPAQPYPYQYDTYWGYEHGQHGQHGQYGQHGQHGQHGQPYHPPGMYQYPGAVGGAGPGVFGSGPGHDASRE